MWYLGKQERVSNLLERIWLGLPSAVQLQPHLDTAENHLFSALEVNAQLDDVSVIDRECLTLLRRRTESDVVEKGTR